jgi:hypothetical protein
VAVGLIASVTFVYSIVVFLALLHTNTNEVIRDPAIADFAFLTQNQVDCSFVE